MNVRCNGNNSPKWLHSLSAGLFTILLVLALFNCPAQGAQIAPDPNFGTIDVTGNDSNLDVPFENLGTINIGTGGTLDNGGLLANSGTLTNSGTLNNNSGILDNLVGTLANSGTLNNSALLDNLSGGTLNNSGTLNNNAGGTLNNNSGGTLNNSGFLSNNLGGILNNSGSLANFDTLINSGTLNNNLGGTLDNKAGGILNNSGTLTNSGSLDNYGTLSNYNNLNNNVAGTLTNSGTLTNDAYLVNSGTLTNSIGGTLTNNYYLKNTGTLTNSNSGELDNYDTLSNIGTLNNFGTLNNNYYLDNFRGGTLNNYGTLTNSNSGELDNYDTLNNSGTLNNIGSLNNFGTLNNNLGGTLNNNGVILNDGTITVLPGGIFNQNASSTYGGSGAIVLGGTLNNSSINPFSITILTFTGGTFNNNGTGATSIRTASVAAGNTGIIQGTSPISLTTANVDGTLTISTIINGSSYLTKNGIGTLVLSAVNTYTGPTFINSGTLSVNGSISSNVIIGASGTLGGTGNIIGNVTNNGTIAPGNSIGTMTITGNYTHNAGAVYQVQVNAAGQSDKLNVTGTATLNGGTVSVLAGSGTYGYNTAYTILTAGSVTGTFSNVTSNYAFLTPSLSYDRSNVYLNLARNDISFAGVAATSNQGAVASALDRAPRVTGDMSTVYNALLGLSAENARSAYNQMGGLSHIALTESSFYAMNQYIGTLTGRIGGFTSGIPVSADTGGLLFASNTIVSSDAMPQWTPQQPQNGLWIRGYGSNDLRRGDDISSRYDAWTGGVIAGYDRRISDSFLLGISAGYSHSEVTMKELSGNDNIDSYQLSAYGAYKRDQWYVDGLLAYGYNSYSSNRSVVIDTISRNAQAEYSGNSFSAYAETGYRLRTNTIDIIPVAGLQGSVLARNGFTEHGADSLDLVAGSDTTWSLVSSLGARITRQYAVGKGGTLTPEVSAKWLHEFSNQSYLLNAAFAGAPAATFTVKGDRPDRDSAEIGVAMNYAVDRNLNLFITYDATVANDRTIQGGSAGARFVW